MGPRNTNAHPPTLRAFTQNRFHEHDRPLAPRPPPRAVVQPSWSVSRRARARGGPHPLSRSDRRGPAERPAPAVDGLYADIGFVGARRRGGLEAVAGDQSQGPQAVGGWAGEDFPGCDLRGAVPARVDGDLSRGGTGLGGHGGSVAGPPHPREAEGPVGLDTCREVRVEEELAVPVELGEARLAAPADEGVTVGQGLRVALGGGEPPVRYARTRAPGWPSWRPRRASR